MQVKMKPERESIDEKCESEGKVKMSKSEEQVNVKEEMRYCRKGKRRGEKEN